MEKVLTGAVESLFKPDCGAGLNNRAHMLAKWGLKRILKVDRFDKMYEEYQQSSSQNHFPDRILQTFKVTYELSEQDLKRIPSTGSLVIVANHPFGGVEGIIMGSILGSVRSDTKIMANYLLKAIAVPEFLEMFFFVDPFGREQSARSNIKPLRESIEWLKAGNALGIFPSGEVSRLYPSRLEVIDPPWSDTTARIIRRTRATVLPMYFEGSNGLLFHIAGLINSRLRTLMLAREMLNKSRQNIRVKIARPIPFEKLEGLADEKIVEYVRLRTYMLKNRQTNEGKPHAPGARKSAKEFEPIVAPRPSSALCREIDALSPDHILVDTARFAVFSAVADQIPNIMYEIGRLREITFREAGEGTRKSIDTDWFDKHYTHLFLWNKKEEELVGAYRLGLTDKILERYGVEGLYTRTLFEYGTEFLQRIGPAIEVGRSFVRPEYQKDYHPLMLLWKGIGRFVVEHPRYRNLFGPVSINSDYQAISRRLIVAFSRQNTENTDLARLVRGRNPPGLYPLKGDTHKAASFLGPNIDDLSELISDMEGDRKGIPILLKHYMRLGGELLGFSVDHHFSDVLDALVLVDLARTDPKMLDRYMGKEGRRTFLGRHDADLSTEAGLCA